jgi:hypothetical protein
MLNAIIILDNVHCFKEDPEYGDILKRMRDGDLSTEDHKRKKSHWIKWSSTAVTLRR